ncbi:alpha/beta-hydrolase [Acephala macrosclerotiorum]|nr:alpha/beta-hydrolase [Acephala macrosclerotiorum]
MPISQLGSSNLRSTQTFLQSSMLLLMGRNAHKPSSPIRMEDCLGLPPTITTVSHAPDIFDEFNCLNLNITIPSGAKAGDNLPVMVYVHGGGGFSGSSSDWWCDGGAIVKRSVEIGKQVVMVAINHRLGVFGYMGSQELGEVNGKENTANFGPRDINTALTWISRSITPFGGSPHSITIYGESHGSTAIATQLHSSPRFPAVFSRAIIQSQTLGAPLFATPLSLSTASSLYAATKSVLNVTTVKELEEVEWERLVEAYQKSDPRNGFGHVPVIDNIFFLENWKEEIKIWGLNEESCY